MIIPSSPPLLPDLNTDDGDLGDNNQDAVVPFAARDIGSLSPPARPSRKRQFPEYDSPSSDPVFSEDASEADVADYDQTHPRRKRWVAGPWWNQRKSSAQCLRQTMAKRNRPRNHDSGVWMGSDISDDSIDWDGSAHLPDEPATPVVPELYGGKRRQVEAWEPPSVAEKVAGSRIHTCLETGGESVDLSGLGLPSISDDTLRPLHQLIRNPHPDRADAPSEDEFGPLIPAIQLYLSGNKLAALPHELFSLTNITVLSLRNNNLSYLPPAIARLNHLRELNVGQNHIRYLPWELFGLVHSKGSQHIIVRPNPLLAPADITGPSPLPCPSATPAEIVDALSKWGEIDGEFHKRLREWYRRDGVSWGAREELEIRLKLGRTRRSNYILEASRSGEELVLSREPPVFLASSAIHFFGVDGSSIRTGHEAVPNPDDFSANLGTPTPLPDTSTSPAVPSLFELCLRNIQTIYAASDLRDPPESLPIRIQSGLKAITSDGSSGNGDCATCGRHFVIARAEWVEYWFNGFPSQECLTQESVQPFLRRVCSWQCASPTALGGFCY